MLVGSYTVVAEVFSAWHQLFAAVTQSNQPMMDGVTLNECSQSFATAFNWFRSELLLLMETLSHCCNNGDGNAAVFELDL